MQGRRPALVPPEGISPVQKEGSHGGGTSRPHCAVQGRHATFVFRIRIRASPNQELDDDILRIGVPGIRPGNPICRVVQRLGATSVSGPDVCPPRNELLGDVSLVGGGRDVQRGIASVGVVGDLLEEMID